MAQRCFFITTRHPLASAASSTPPQLPLGEETPRNKKTSGQPAPSPNTRRQARHHQCRPSFHWGVKPQGTKKSFPWGTKPWGQEKSFLWGTKPRGQQQQQQRPTFKGAVERRRASLRGRNPRDKRRASIGGGNPGDNSNDNAQPSRVRSHNDKKIATRFMDKSRTMVIKNHGHRKDNGHNYKDNDKEDAQPPTVRLTNQASPSECIFIFSQKQPTTLNIA